MLYKSNETELEIRVVEVVPNELPTPGDFRIATRIKLDGFSATSDTTWIDFQAWKAFQLELKQLENVRKGTAQIQAMSPEDFHLSIRDYERRGSMLCEGHLSRRVIGHSQRLEFRFLIESEDVTRFLSELSDLTRNNHAID